MVEQAGLPSRADPLHGLKPMHFTKNLDWPAGRVEIPDQLTKVGLDSEQVERVMADVLALRQLVLDYEFHLMRTKYSAAKVARDIAVSTNRLSALRTGKGWPSWRLYVALRAYVPARDAQGWETANPMHVKRDRQDLERQGRRADEILKREKQRR